MKIQYLQAMRTILVSAAILTLSATAMAAGTVASTAPKMKMRGWGRANLLIS